LQALAALRTFRHCAGGAERGDYPEISRVFFLLKRGLAEPGASAFGSGGGRLPRKSAPRGDAPALRPGKAHYAGRSTVRVKAQ
jgi:hypothetical protein